MDHEIVPSTPSTFPATGWSALYTGLVEGWDQSPAASGLDALPVPSGSVHDGRMPSDVITSPSDGLPGTGRRADFGASTFELTSRESLDRIRVLENGAGHWQSEPS